MKLKISLKESFERLTQREKNLIALLAGIVLLFIGAGSFFFYNSMVSGYEEEIGNGREKLSEIRDKTPAFAKLLDERKMIEAALKNNKITSLRIPLNDIAKRINADESGGIEAGEGSNLSDIISFEGKTHEVAVEKKGKKKGKKGKDEETVVEIEQGMELRDAPVT
ncbi:MAG: hypothetical protein FJ088_14555, partial [Deltaproteobacteria bacterium]|nr:hypothetical protein [Deltaproteobacteria bacterium]